MKIWKLNLYSKYFDLTKKGMKLWECRRDSYNYQIGDQIEFTDKLKKQKIYCEIIDIFKTNDIYSNTNLIILTLKLL